MAGGLALALAGQCQTKVLVSDCMSYALVLALTGPGHNMKMLPWDQHQMKSIAHQTLHITTEMLLTLMDTVKKEAREKVIKIQEALSVLKRVVEAIAALAKLCWLTAIAEHYGLCFLRLCRPDRALQKVAGLHSLNLCVRGGFPLFWGGIQNTCGRAMSFFLRERTLHLFSFIVVKTLDEAAGASKKASDGLKVYSTPLLSTISCVSHGKLDVPQLFQAADVAPWSPFKDGKNTLSLPELQDQEVFPPAEGAPSQNFPNFSQLQRQSTRRHNTGTSSRVFSHGGRSEGRGFLVAPSKPIIVENKPRLHIRKKDYYIWNHKKKKKKVLQTENYKMFQNTGSKLLTDNRDLALREVSMPCSGMCSQEVPMPPLLRCGRSPEYLKQLRGNKEIIILYQKKPCPQSVPEKVEVPRHVPVNRIGGSSLSGTSVTDSNSSGHRESRSQEPGVYIDNDAILTRVVCDVPYSRKTAASTRTQFSMYKRRKPKTFWSFIKDNIADMIHTKVAKKPPKGKMPLKHNEKMSPATNLPRSIIKDSVLGTANTGVAKEPSKKKLLFKDGERKISMKHLDGANDKPLIDMIQQNQPNHGEGKQFQINTIPGGGKSNNPMDCREASNRKDADDTLENSGNVPPRLRCYQDGTEGIQCFNTINDERYENLNLIHDDSEVPNDVPTTDYERNQNIHKCSLEFDMCTTKPRVTTELDSSMTINIGDRYPDNYYEVVPNGYGRTQNARDRVTDSSPRRTTSQERFIFNDDRNVSSSCNYFEHEYSEDELESGCSMKVMQGSITSSEYNYDSSRFIFGPCNSGPDADPKTPDNCHRNRSVRNDITEEFRRYFKLDNMSATHPTIAKVQSSLEPPGVIASARQVSLSTSAHKESVSTTQISQNNKYMDYKSEIRAPERHTSIRDADIIPGVRISVGERRPHNITSEEGPYEEYERVQQPPFRISSASNAKGVLNVDVRRKALVVSPNESIYENFRHREDYFSNDPSVRTTPIKHVSPSVEVTDRRQRRLSPTEGPRENHDKFERSKERDYGRSDNKEIIPTNASAFVDSRVARRQNVRGPSLSFLELSGVDNNDRKNTHECVNDPDFERMAMRNKCPSHESSSRRRSTSPTKWLHENHDLIDRICENYYDRKEFIKNIIYPNSTVNIDASRRGYSTIEGSREDHEKSVAHLESNYDRSHSVRKEMFTTVPINVNGERRRLPPLGDSCEDYEKFERYRESFYEQSEPIIKRVSTNAPEMVDVRTRRSLSPIASSREELDQVERIHESVHDRDESIINRTSTNKPVIVNVGSVKRNVSTIEGSHKDYGRVERNRECDYDRRCSVRKANSKNTPSIVDVSGRRRFFPVELSRKENSSGQSSREGVSDKHVKTKADLDEFLCDDINCRSRQDESPNVWLPESYYKGPNACGSVCSANYSVYPQLLLRTGTARNGYLSENVGARRSKNLHPMECRLQDYEKAQSIPENLCDISGSDFRNPDLRITTASLAPSYDEVNARINGSLSSIACLHESNSSETRFQGCDRKNCDSLFSKSVIRTRTDRNGSPPYEVSNTKCPSLSPVPSSREDTGRQQIFSVHVYRKNGCEVQNPSVLTSSVTDRYVPHEVNNRRSRSLSSFDDNGSGHIFSVNIYDGSVSIFRNSKERERNCMNRPIPYEVSCRRSRSLPREVYSGEQSFLRSDNDTVHPNQTLITTRPQRVEVGGVNNSSTSLGQSIRITVNPYSPNTQCDSRDWPVNAKFPEGRHLNSAPEEVINHESNTYYFDMMNKNDYTHNEQCTSHCTAPHREDYPIEIADEYNMELIYRKHKMEERNIVRYCPPNGKLDGNILPYPLPNEILLQGFTRSQQPRQYHAQEQESVRGPGYWNDEWEIQESALERRSSNEDRNCSYGGESVRSKPIVRIDRIDNHNIGQIHGNFTRDRQKVSSQRINLSRKSYSRSNDKETRISSTQNEMFQDQLQCYSHCRRDRQETALQNQCSTSPSSITSDACRNTSCRITSRNTKDSNKDIITVYPRNITERQKSILKERVCQKQDTSKRDAAQINTSIVNCQTASTENQVKRPSNQKIRADRRETALTSGYTSEQRNLDEYAAEIFISNIVNQNDERGHSNEILRRDRKESSPKQKSKPSQPDEVDKDESKPSSEISRIMDTKKHKKDHTDSKKYRQESKLEEQSEPKNYVSLITTSNTSHVLNVEERDRINTDCAVNSQDAKLDTKFTSKHIGTGKNVDLTAMPSKIYQVMRLEYQERKHNYEELTMDTQESTQEERSTKQLSSGADSTEFICSITMDDGMNIEIQGREQRNREDRSNRQQSILDVRGYPKQRPAAGDAGVATASRSTARDMILEDQEGSPSTRVTNLYKPNSTLQRKVLPKQVCYVAKASKTAISSRTSHSVKSKDQVGCQMYRQNIEDNNEPTLQSTSLEQKSSCLNIEDNVTSSAVSRRLILRDHESLRMNPQGTVNSQQTTLQNRESIQQTSSFVNTTTTTISYAEGVLLEGKDTDKSNSHCVKETPETTNPRIVSSQHISSGLGTGTCHHVQLEDKNTAINNSITGEGTSKLTVKSRISHNQISSSVHDVNNNISIPTSFGTEFPDQTKCPCSPKSKEYIKTPTTLQRRYSPTRRHFCVDAGDIRMSSTTQGVNILDGEGRKVISSSGSDKGELTLKDRCIPNQYSISAHSKTTVYSTPPREILSTKDICINILQNTNGERESASQDKSPLMRVADLSGKTSVQENASGKLVKKSRGYVNETQIPIKQSSSIFSDQIKDQKHPDSRNENRDTDLQIRGTPHTKSGILSASQMETSSIISENMRHEEHRTDLHCPENMGNKQEIIKDTRTPEQNVHETVPKTRMYSTTSQGLTLRTQESGHPERKNVKDRLILESACYHKMNYCSVNPDSRTVQVLTKQKLGIDPRHPERGKDGEGLTSQSCRIPKEHDSNLGPAIEMRNATVIHYNDQDKNQDDHIKHISDNQEWGLETGSVPAQGREQSNRESKRDSQKLIVEDEKTPRASSGVNCKISQDSRSKVPRRSHTHRGRIRNNNESILKMTHIVHPHQETNQTRIDSRPERRQTESYKEQIGANTDKSVTHKRRLEGIKYENDNKFQKQPDSGSEGQEIKLQGKSIANHIYQGTVNSKISQVIGHEDQDRDVIYQNCTRNQKVSTFVETDSDKQDPSDAVARKIRTSNTIHRPEFQEKKTQECNTENKHEKDVSANQAIRPQKMKHAGADNNKSGVTDVMKEGINIDDQQREQNMCVNGRDIDESISQIKRTSKQVLSYDDSDKTRTFNINPTNIHTACKIKDQRNSKNGENKSKKIFQGKSSHNNDRCRTISTHGKITGITDSAHEEDGQSDLKSRGLNQESTLEHSGISTKHTDFKERNLSRQSKNSDIQRHHLRRREDMQESTLTNSDRPSIHCESSCTTICGLKPYNAAKRQIYRNTSHNRPKSILERGTSDTVETQMTNIKTPNFEDRERNQNRTKISGKNTDVILKKEISCGKSFCGTEASTMNKARSNSKGAKYNFLESGKAPSEEKSMINHERSSLKRSCVKERKGHIQSRESADDRDVEAVGSCHRSLDKKTEHYQKRSRNSHRNSRDECESSRRSSLRSDVQPRRFNSSISEDVERLYYYRIEPEESNDSCASTVQKIVRLYPTLCKEYSGRVNEAKSWSTGYCNKERQELDRRNSLNILSTNRKLLDSQVRRDEAATEIMDLLSDLCDSLGTSASDQQINCNSRRKRHKTDRERSAAIGRKGSRSCTTKHKTDAHHQRRNSHCCAPRSKNSRVSEYDDDTDELSLGSETSRRAYCSSRRKRTAAAETDEKRKHLSVVHEIKHASRRPEEEYDQAHVRPSTKNVVGGDICTFNFHDSSICFEQHIHVKDEEEKISENKRNNKRKKSQ